MMIIGLVGLAGSGKGTAGDILKREYHFRPIAFADAVKDATSAIFGWSRDLLEGDTESSRIFRETVDPWWAEALDYPTFTPRIALQLMGTEAGRNVFHPDLWVKVVEQKLAMHQIMKHHVVITDVRFPNEVASIQEQGGFVVRVTRGPDPEWYEIAMFDNTANKMSAPRMQTEYPNIHYSEWAWIGTQYDYVLDNNGSLEMLGTQIKCMIKLFTGPQKPDIISEK
jgi:hypothetical protein